MILSIVHISDCNWCKTKTRWEIKEPQVLFEANSGGGEMATEGFSGTREHMRSFPKHRAGTPNALRKSLWHAVVTRWSQIKVPLNAHQPVSDGIGSISLGNRCKIPTSVALASVNPLLKKRNKLQTSPKYGSRIIWRHWDGKCGIDTDAGIPKSAAGRLGTRCRDKETLGCNNLNTLWRLYKDFVRPTKDGDETLSRISITYRDFASNTLHVSKIKFQVPYNQTRRIWNSMRVLTKQHIGVPQTGCCHL